MFNTHQMVNEKTVSTDVIVLMIQWRCENSKKGISSSMLHIITTIATSSLIFFITTKK